MSSTKAWLIGSLIGLTAAVSCGGRVLEKVSSFDDASRGDAGSSPSPGGGPSDRGPNVDASSPSGPGLYALVAIDSGFGPGFAADGVAFDGSELWTLSPTGDPQPYRLLRFGLDAIVTDESFTLPWLYDESTAAKLAGMTWNGSAIVIGIANGSDGGLETIDMGSHQVSQTVAAPPTFAVGPTFDGTDFFVSDGASNVFRIQTSGAVDSQFSTAVTEIRGLAYRPGELFVIGASGIEVVDPATGARLGDVSLDERDAGPRIFGPAVFADDDLFMLSPYEIPDPGFRRYKVVKTR